MPARLEWSASQRQAWEYVLHGVAEGLTQTGALAAYRSGGGAIRDSYWRELWHKDAEATEAWSQLGYLRSSDSVPARMFEETGIGFSEQYVMAIKATARTETGEVIPDLYRYVQSDQRLTWGEWQGAAGDTLLTDPSARGIVKYEITDISFFERAMA